MQIRFGDLRGEFVWDIRKSPSDYTCALTVERTITSMRVGAKSVTRTKDRNRFCMMVLLVCSGRHVSIQLPKHTTRGFTLSYYCRSARQLIVLSHKAAQGSVFERCFNDFALPHETGSVEWAIPAKSMDLSAFEIFGAPFPG